jgi:hypothetical protein
MFMGNMGSLLVSVPCLLCQLACGAELGYWSHPASRAGIQGEHLDMAKTALYNLSVSIMAPASGQLLLERMTLKCWSSRRLLRAVGLCCTDMGSDERRKVMTMFR